MTNDEHDSLILAKCREIANWPQVAPTMKALALSTIVAIEGLQAAESLIYSVQNDYDDSPTRWWIEQRTKVVGALEAIRSAWPKELL